MVEEKEEELVLWRQEVGRLEDELVNLEDSEQNILDMANRI